LSGQTERNYTRRSVCSARPRIEGANRIYGTRVLLAESTVRAAGTEIETRELDAIAVKGKTEPTRIFEFLGVAGQGSEPASRLRDRHRDALTACRAQDWGLAETGFRECLELQPNDGPSTLMLGRIAAFRVRPSDAGWDGVWRLSEK